MMQPAEGLSAQDFVHLRSAIDEAAIVAITNSNGIITYVNQKFCQISKYSRDELLGSNHRIINSGYHEPEFFIEMWQTISSGRVWEGEIRNRAKDGTYYWVNTTIVPFLDQNGKPQQYVAVRYEITQRKLAEEQLRIYAKKLEISNRELEDFASIAAHDLQEPLRKILAFSDRLKTKGESQLSPDLVDYIDRMQNSAARMQTLINDLLTYSRVTTRAQPFQRVDLNQTMEQVKSDLELRLEQGKGSLQWKNLPTIESDATQMHQLFLNLVGNALKFAKNEVPGEVHIEACPVFVSKGSNFWQITVQDNGIGFEDKYADKIFTIFQRLHGRHEYEGTGIGLAVCRKIVDRHGGQIRASGKLGIGAQFTLILPEQQSTGDLNGHKT